MNLPTKRGYARAYMEASIKYTLPESGEYHRGVMKNCSVGGMYFAADRPLAPGAEVKIQVLSEKRDCLLPVDLNTHKAEVAWCSALETSSGRFGIGIKFFSLPGETK
jgi:hypothetical protein